MTKFIADNDLLDLGQAPDAACNWYLQAIHTPGHAPGHLSFYDPHYRLLYVGDMVVDVQTARGAGVTVWIVPTGSDDRDTLVAAKPDRMLADLAEIVKLLRDS